MQEFAIRQFLGLNNVQDPSNVGIKIADHTTVPKKGIGLIKADNVDIDDEFSIERRDGYTKVFNQSGVHSLSSDAPGYFIQDVSLFYIDRVDVPSKTMDYRVVRTDITSGFSHRMKYLQIGKNIYHTNGIQTGVIYDIDKYRTWGIVPPIGQPTPTYQPTGYLKAGQYQVAMTYVRNDGQESGTGVAATVNVPSDGGAIILSSIPVSGDPSVSEKRIYISNPDGSGLFYHKSIGPAVISDSVTWIGENSISLETQFKRTAPPGQSITLYNGQIYIASGKYLYFSDPFAYEIFDDRNYFTFDSDIAFVRAVESGIFIATKNKTSFLSGGSSSDLKLKPRMKYGAIPHTDIHTDFVTFDKTSKTVVVWTSPYGVCIGMPDGEVSNITFDYYRPPKSDMGFGWVKSKNGSFQYIAMLSKIGNTDNGYVGPVIDKSTRINYKETNNA